MDKILEKQNSLTNNLLLKGDNIKTLVKDENKYEIKELLNDRKTKLKLLGYINIIQIILIIISACMGFLTTAIESNGTHVFTIIAGMSNVIFLSCESLKKNIYKNLNSIKNTIATYDEMKSNELIQIDEN